MARARADKRAPGRRGPFKGEGKAGRPAAVAVAEKRGPARAPFTQLLLKKGGVSGKWDDDEGEKRSGQTWRTWPSPLLLSRPSFPPSLPPTQAERFFSPQARREAAACSPPAGSGSAARGGCASSCPWRQGPERPPEPARQGESAGRSVSRAPQPPPPRPPSLLAASRLALGLFAGVGGPLLPSAEPERLTDCLPGPPERASGKATARGRGGRGAQKRASERATPRNFVVTAAPPLGLPTTTTL